MKKDDDEPNVWVTVIKLVVGATILIGGVGFALWYVAKEQEGDFPPPPDKTWGIVTDNPLKNKR
jgi:hypothetical protein